MQKVLYIWIDIIAFHLITFCNSNKLSIKIKRAIKSKIKKIALLKKTQWLMQKLAKQIVTS